LHCSASSLGSLQTVMSSKTYTPMKWQ
jgi:hypothetical protein